MGKINESNSTYIKENTEVFLNDFAKLVEARNIATIKYLLKFLTNSIQGELITKSYYNNKVYPDSINYITQTFFIGQPYENYYKPCNLCMEIKTTPIITCVWNHKRIIEQLSKIGKNNKNPFNGESEESAQNITATLLTPLGLVLVNNGNHSVNSALVQNEGRITVKYIIDMATSFKRYKFDGENYIYIGNDKEKVSKKINDGHLKNNSEPFTYTMGLLFEIARILSKNNINLVSA
ncbi:DUF6710 family protein [Pectinatus frisingensis]|uniref:DUF6710 family protein n=1 Tax=Pectinatus frisingensis TaxID=865 RepID=UPI0018C705CB|nr:DUF6710 family protein [Pectinatus frisingensis]